MGRQHPWERYSTRQRNLFLAILFVTGIFNLADRLLISVLLEPIKQEFQVSDTMLGLLSGVSFAIFYATLGIPVARWADRGDRRLILTLSFSFWSVMTAICGLAQNFWQLALARVGVGAGEAGGMPTAFSLIGDYFPPEKRVRAIGIFGMSGGIGSIFGLAVGGWVAQHYGWRAAFFGFGLPGLLFALVAYFLLREPRRVEQFAVPKGQQEAVTTTFKILFGKRSFRAMLGAFMVYWIVASGVVLFIPSFIMRVHGLDLAQTGAMFGGLGAASTILGNLLGGVLTERLSSRDPSWIARLPGWALICALPFFCAFLMVENLIVLAGFYFAGSLFLAASLPAMIASVQSVCGAHRRAVSIAITFFFANLVGYGFGPVFTGAVSDLFAQSYGPAQGLRLALLAGITLLIPAGLFMVRAAKHFSADQEF